MKLNMYLLPNDTLVKVSEEELIEVNEEWVKSIVEATEQYDMENELILVAKHAQEVIVLANVDDCEAAGDEFEHEGQYEVAGEDLDQALLDL